MDEIFALDYISKDLILWNFSDQQSVRNSGCVNAPIPRKRGGLVGKLIVELCSALAGECIYVSVNFGYFEMT